MLGGSDRQKCTRPSKEDVISLYGGCKFPEQYNISDTKADNTVLLQSIDKSLMLSQGSGPQFQTIFLRE